MERLTIKCINDKDYLISDELTTFMNEESKTRFMKQRQREANNKLGQLEDIEEESGIDLITFFSEIEKPKVKHFENIYFKYKGKTYKIEEIRR